MASRLRRSALLWALLGVPGLAQTTDRASLSTSGSQAAKHCYRPVVSADGRCVAFQSEAEELVSGDTNSVLDVFVHDRRRRTTERVSVSTAGQEGNGPSARLSISADGRFVAFGSQATNFIPNDSNGSASDVFVRDRVAGTTELASLSTGGAQSNSWNDDPSISGDGRFVAFESSATNLDPLDSNGKVDVFVRDRSTGTTELVSVGRGGIQGDGPSYIPSISADGRYVAFYSDATNLVANDSNDATDVFVHDRLTGATERASIATGGTQADAGPIFLNRIAISGDGRFVAFESDATTLVAGDVNQMPDVFVRDLRGRTTELASVSSSGAQSNYWSNAPSISADGRFVAFASWADNLDPLDSNGSVDIFLRDRRSGTTAKAIYATGGAQGDSHSGESGLSANGLVLAFDDASTNLVAGDTNAVWDVFVRDLDTTAMPSLCEPDVQGVAACPCVNPASGPGRGCSNSAGTDGASLSAAGAATLAADTVVFTTESEPDGAASVLLQGDAFLPAGATYGQGVRCVEGALKRLFSRTAIRGRTTIPDFGAGDPSISARSALLGDAIQPGESRWYFVFYRDSEVLGGCPASSTFNATQTRQATWSP